MRKRVYSLLFRTDEVAFGILSPGDFALGSENRSKQSPLLNLPLTLHGFMSNLYAKQ